MYFLIISIGVPIEKKKKHKYSLQKSYPPSARNVKRFIQIYYLNLNLY